MRQDLTIPCGSSKVLYCTQDCTGYDITGWTLQCVVKANKEDFTPLLTKDLTSGVTVINAKLGTFYVQFTETDLTLPVGTYYWAIGRTDAGFAEPLVEGQLHIVPNVLAPSPASITPQPGP